MSLPDKPKKIALFTSSFGTNGVSRVRITLAREFLNMGFGVDFVVRHAMGPLKEECPPECKIVELGVDRPRHLVIKLVQYMHKERPDGMIVASWPNTISALIARLVYRRSLPLIVSEHFDFRHDPEMTPRDLWLLRHAAAHFYRTATKVVAVSAGVKESLIEVTGIEAEQISVIHNPFRPDTNTVRQSGDDEILHWWGTSRKLLSLGRLEKTKGYDILLKALAVVRESVDAKLLIMGEGRQRKELQELIISLGLQDAVRMPGFRNEVYPFFKAADLFVLSSYNEGVANVLVEALSQGVPIVSTNCKSGPEEILAGGRYGQLCEVGSVESLATEILRSLKQDHDTASLRQRATEFSPILIASQYVNLLFGDASLHMPA